MYKREQGLKQPCFLLESLCAWIYVGELIRVDLEGRTRTCGFMLENTCAWVLILICWFLYPIFISTLVLKMWIFYIEEFPTLKTQTLGIDWIPD